MYKAIMIGSSDEQIIKMLKKQYIIHTKTFIKKEYINKKGKRIKDFKNFDLLNIEYYKVKKGATGVNVYYNDTKTSAKKSRWGLFDELKVDFGDDNNDADDEMVGDDIISSDDKTPSRKRRKLDPTEFQANQQNILMEIRTLRKDMNNKRIGPSITASPKHKNLSTTQYQRMQSRKLDMHSKEHIVHATGNNFKVIHESILNDHNEDENRTLYDKILNAGTNKDNVQHLQGL